MREHDLIRRLFDQARLLPGPEREAFVRGQAPSAAIAEQVLQLLAHDSGSREFLERPAVLPVAAAAVGPPARIAEFEIVREIGHGGMGVVYEARDTVLNRAVALKLLAAHLVGSAQAREKFFDEARAAAGLNHPAIVPVHKCGTDGSVHYIVSEFVAGTTLGALLDAERARRAGMADTGSTRTWQRRCAEIVATIADALETAHRAKLVHRDVKPSNILIDGEGRARLTDFGIALHLTDETRTHESSLVGSCYYMSPEQVSFVKLRIDQRTDIYSLGVVLYELLALRRPFDGRDIRQVLQAVLLSDPPALRSLARAVPRDLETICAKAMRRDPRERYQTAAHFAADLRCFLSGDPILARPDGLARRARRGLWRHRRPLAVVLLVALLGTALGQAYLAQRQRDARLARIRVTCARPDARVLIRPLHSDGPVARPALRTPLPVQPGRYQVVVESGSAEGFAETTVNALRAGRVYEIDVPIRATAGVVENMVLIPARSHALGGGGGIDAREVALPAFWIDRHEVSNGQYRAFMIATGYRAPLFWQDAGDPAWETLPVVGVTYVDAAAYALWAGKRLPSADEWEAAARAPDGRLLPWGPTSGPALPPVGVAERFYGSTSADGYKQYLAGAVAVDADTNSRSPLGLLHTFGNVSELTDSFDRSRGVTVKGGPWYLSPASFSLANCFSLPQSIDPVDDFESRMGVSADTGFRCAKSISSEPEP